jgi:hypothetical protein
MGGKRRPRQKARRKGAKNRNKAGSPKQSNKRRVGKSLFGFMAGEFEIVGDIVSPIPDWEYWDPEECLEK